MTVPSQGSPNHEGICWRLFCQACSRQIDDCGCSGQYGDWETRRDTTRCERCVGLGGEYEPADPPPPEVPILPPGAF